MALFHFSGVMLSLVLYWIVVIAEVTTTFCLCVLLLGKCLASTGSEVKRGSRGVAAVLQVASATASSSASHYEADSGPTGYASSCLSLFPGWASAAFSSSSLRYEAGHGPTGYASSCLIIPLASTTWGLQYEADFCPTGYASSCLSSSSGGACQHISARQGARRTSVPRAAPAAASPALELLDGDCL